MTQHFIDALPPPYKASGRIYLSETLRRDIALAVTTGAIPTAARFWLRELSSSPVISVELVGWAGPVLAEDYATAFMERSLPQPMVTLTDSGASFNRGTENRRITSTDSKYLVTKASDLSTVYVRMDLSMVQVGIVRGVDAAQDSRFTPEVNAALALIRAVADRRCAQKMAEHPENYYGPIQYLVEIKSARLIAAAERGLRQEVDPEYADFMCRVRTASVRLGRGAVRSICGEGGVDLSEEEGLEELVRLDTEAGGRPVAYNRRLGRWGVEEHA